MRPQQDPFRHRLPADAGARLWCSPCSTPAASVDQPRLVVARPRPEPVRSAATADPGDRRGGRPRGASGRRSRACRGRRPDVTRTSPSAPDRRLGDRRGRRAAAAGRGRATASRRPPVHRVVAPSRSPGTAPSASPGTHGDRARRRRDHAFRSAPAPTAPGRTGRTMPYHDEHGPDPGSAEAPRRPPRHRRRCSSATSTRCRSRRVTTPARAPRRHAGSRSSTRATHGAPPTGEAGDRHRHGCDGRHASTPRPTDDPPPTSHRPGAGATADARPIALQAATYTPKPQIFSRAQWGADERMRDKSSLHYFEVHAGFVHHTVNANDYTARPGARRSCAASTPTTPSPAAGATSATTSSSTGSAGSGRAGTAASTVRSSARTRSATTTTRSRCRRSATSRPPSRRRRCSTAYGRAVRLEALAARRRRRVDQAVGRLDATSRPSTATATSATTACPGKYLYAKIPQIRALAAAVPASVRQPRSSTEPRRLRAARTSSCATSDEAGLRRCAPAGQVGFARATAPRPGAPARTGHRDARRHRRRQGRRARPRSRPTAGDRVYPGDGAGRLRRRAAHPRPFAGLDQLTGGRRPERRRPQRPGRPQRRHRAALRSTPATATARSASDDRCAPDWSDYSVTAGAGDLERRRPRRPGRPATGRRACGWSPGTGRPARRPGRAAAARWSGYDLITGIGDVTDDGKPDLVARDAATKLAYVYPGDGRRRPRALRSVRFAGSPASTSLLAAGQRDRLRRPDLVGAATAAVRCVVFANGGGTGVDGGDPRSARAFADAEPRPQRRRLERRRPRRRDDPPRRPTGSMLLLRRPAATAASRPRSSPRQRLRRRSAARRRRRHHRRRLPRPDGPADRRRDADLPGQRHHRASGAATSRTARSAPTDQVGVGPVGRRRRPGQPVPRSATGRSRLYRGQRPGRAHRQRDQVGTSAGRLRLDGRGRRRGRRRPRRPARRASSATGTSGCCPGTATRPRRRGASSPSGFGTYDLAG